MLLSSFKKIVAASLSISLISSSVLAQEADRPNLKAVQDLQQRADHIDNLQTILERVSAHEKILKRDQKSLSEVESQIKASDGGDKTVDSQVQLQHELDQRSQLKNEIANIQEDLANPPSGDLLKKEISEEQGRYNALKEQLSSADQKVLTAHEIDITLAKIDKLSDEASARKAAIEEENERRSTSEKRWFLTWLGSAFAFISTDRTTAGDNDNVMSEISYGKKVDTAMNIIQGAAFVVGAISVVMLTRDVWKQYSDPQLKQQADEVVKLQQMLDLEKNNLLALKASLK